MQLQTTELHPHSDHTNAHAVLQKAFDQYRGPTARYGSWGLLRPKPFHARVYAHLQRLFLVNILFLLSFLFWSFYCSFSPSMHPLSVADVKTKGSLEILLLIQPLRSSQRNLQPAEEKKKEREPMHFSLSGAFDCRFKRRRSLVSSL